MYYKHLGYQTSIFGKNCAYYIRIFKLNLIDTISCSNHCMLMLYCLITHLIVISRRPEMRDIGTGKLSR